jgi:DNA-binding transcriptional LysR family regulator
VDALIADEADLVLMARLPRTPTMLAVRPLFTIPYAVFCPSDHLLAHKRRLRIAELLKHDLVVFQDSSRVEQLLLDHAHRLDLDLNIAFSGDHGISAFEMISRGLGIGLLPTSFAHRAQRRRMRVIPLEEPELRLQIVALHRAFTPLQQAGGVLLERLLASQPAGTLLEKP